jgi:hypothetical protein
LLAEPSYRIVIALDPQGKMNVGEVDPLVAAKRCFRANQDMELRLSVANPVPDPRMAEAVRAVEFLHFQDVSVKLPRTFQVVNRNRKMMEAESVHGVCWAKVGKAMLIAKPSRATTERIFIVCSGC